MRIRIMRINRQATLLTSVLLTAISQTVLASASDKVNCENAYSTHDMNYCAAQERDAATKTMRRYLIASYNQNKDNSEVIEAIKASQVAWQSYADSHCSAVYTLWQEGTIRGIMSINCDIKMIEARTHELWLNYLTFMDSTPPVLPEPLLD